MSEDICYVTSETGLPFVVEMAGISYCDASYRISRQRSPIAVVEYVLSGRGTVQENDQAFTAGPGDVYLLHPYRRHVYAADSTEPWTKIWCNVRGPLVDSLLQAYQLQQVCHIPACPPALYERFAALLAATRQDLPLAEKLDRCAVHFLEIIVALAGLLRTRAHTPDEASRLLAYIDAHLLEPVGVGDMARAIYRSPSYTTRLFRRTFGQTPYACLAARRIEAARQLLADTNLPVQEIARQLCYADQHYFANVFRHATGQTPRQFRRSCHGETGNIRYNGDKDTQRRSRQD
ncbi:MAG: AraC family transcriptional regulator [Clostridiaceae bacterium]|nr:AraC family transcriptional regulator [Clostridiaceae bacterium]